MPAITCAICTELHETEVLSLFCFLFLSLNQYWWFPKNFCRLWGQQQCIMTPIYYRIAWLWGRLIDLVRLLYVLLWIMSVKFCRCKDRHYTQLIDGHLMFFDILGIRECILVNDIVLYIPNCLAKSYNDTIHKRRKCGKVQCW